MSQVIDNKEKVNQNPSQTNEPNSLAQVVYLLTQMISASQEEAKKRKKASISHSWKITIMTISVSLLGLGFGFHQSKTENEQKRKFQTAQQFQAQINQQIQSMELQIRDKISRRDDLNNAMAKVRNLFENGRLYCENNRYSRDLRMYNEGKNSVVYKVIVANYSINQIFDSNTYQYSSNFLKISDEHKNPCDKPEDIDHQLRLTQRETNKLMEKSIHADELKKEQLVNQLASSPHPSLG